MLRGNWPYLGNNRERRTKEQASAIKDVQKKKKRRNMYRNKVVIAFIPPVFKLSKYIYHHSHYFSLSLFTHILSSSFLLLFVCWAKVLSLFTLLTIHLQFIFSFLFFLTCVPYISNE